MAAKRCQCELAGNATLVPTGRVRKAQAFGNCSDTDVDCTLLESSDLTNSTCSASAVSRVEDHVMEALPPQSLRACQAAASFLQRFFFHTIATLMQLRRASATRSASTSWAATSILDGGSSSNSRESAVRSSSTTSAAETSEVSTASKRATRGAQSKTESTPPHLPHRPSQTKRSCCRPYRKSLASPTEASEAHAAGASRQGGREA
mmetsp:Transcript_98916/g.277026  ORF Transcript_98916/g.277026 Transcript_98916/m.277026 type:complete len:206 (+) Transcript_98916:891-1508(+)